MPVPTPVRAVSIAAALVAVVIGYGWWNRPERHIYRLLSDVASALSHEGPETDLRAVAAVASLQAHLTSDVAIDVGGGAQLRGRQDVMSIAARLRASSPMMRVQCFDPDIQWLSDSSGTTLVTVQVTTLDAGGEEVADAHVVSLDLVKVDGRWQIASAHVLPKDAVL